MFEWIFKRNEKPRPLNTTPTDESSIPNKVAGGSTDGCGQGDKVQSSPAPDYDPGMPADSGRLDADTKYGCESVHCGGEHSCGSH